MILGKYNTRSCMYWHYFDNKSNPYCGNESVTSGMLGRNIAKANYSGQREKEKIFTYQ